VAIGKQQVSNMGREMPFGKHVSSNLRFRRLLNQSNVINTKVFQKNLVTAGQYLTNKSGAKGNVCVPFGGNM
jgi:hypothetical protein